MSTRPWHRLEVIPLTPLAFRARPYFSYAAPASVPRGGVVRIPFGRRQIEGVVFESIPMTTPLPSWIKWIESVDPRLPLTSHQLDLAQWLSEDTLSPLALSLKHFLLPTPKRRTDAPAVVSIRRRLSARDRKQLALILGRSKEESLLFASYNTEVRHFLELLVKKHQEEKKQILFLIPELFLLEWWREELVSMMKEVACSCIHGQLSPRALFDESSIIRNGFSTLILGTRQALFAPFHKLATIVVFDEEDDLGWKQWEMSPRYSALRVVSQLAHLYGAKIISFTPTPRLATLEAIDKGEKRLLPLASATFRRPIETINMRFEKNTRTKPLFSTRLFETIKETLGDKKKVLLIARQAGWSSFILCRDCRTILRCPQCSRVLSGKRDGRYQCLGCGLCLPLFPHCPSCQSLHFVSFGAGTDRVEHLLRQHFPRARLLRLDRDARRHRQSFRTTVRKLHRGEFDIAIGTRSLARVPRLPDADLIAMIEADSLLAFLDYRAEEALVQDLERLRYLGAPTNRSPILLQTFEPERSLWSLARDTPFLEIGGTLLKERASLHYPPFTRFLRIECPNKELSRSQIQAESIWKELNEWLKNSSKNNSLAIRLIAPHLPLVPSRSRKPAYRLLLSFPSHTPLPLSLVSLLKRYASHVIYDFDPLTLT